MGKDKEEKQGEAKPKRRPSEDLFLLLPHFPHGRGGRLASLLGSRIGVLLGGENVERGERRVGRKWGLFGIAKRKKRGMNGLGGGSERGRL